MWVKAKVKKKTIGIMDTRGVCSHYGKKLLSVGRLEEGNACHCRWSREPHLDPFPPQNKSPNAWGKGQQALSLSGHKRKHTAAGEGAGSHPGSESIRYFPLPKEKGLLRNLPSKTQEGSACQD